MVMVMPGLVALTMQTFFSIPALEDVDPPAIDRIGSLYEIKAPNR
jgi:hypothetical protein